MNDHPDSLRVTYGEFIERNYRYKSAAQIPHNAELVPVLYTGRKIFPYKKPTERCFS